MYYICMHVYKNTIYKIKNYSFFFFVAMIFMCKKYIYMYMYIFKKILFDLL